MIIVKLFWRKTKTMTDLEALQLIWDIVQLYHDTLEESEQNADLYEEICEAMYHLHERLDVNVEDIE
jgi:hypothetical protein